MGYPRTVGRSIHRWEKWRNLYISIACRVCVCARHWKISVCTCRWVCQVDIARSTKDAKNRETRKTRAPPRRRSGSISLRHKVGSRPFGFEVAGAPIRSNKMSAKSVTSPEPLARGRLKAGVWTFQVPPRTYVTRSFAPRHKGRSYLEN